MEQDRIRELLEKFDKAETSLKEEAILKDYFLNNEAVPEDLQEYKMYFTWSHEMKEIQAPSSLAADLKGQWSNTEIRQSYTRIVTLRRWTSWAAAAVIILIASFWFIKTDSYEFNDQNNGLVYQETYDDPEKAYEQTMQALAFLSNKLNSGQNKATGSMKKLKQLDQAIPNN